jgi:hypothetical protein
VHQAPRVALQCVTWAGSASSRLPRIVAKLVVAALLTVACTSSPHASNVSRQTPGPIGDTWIRQGQSWHQVEGPHPSPRYAASLAYDAARQVYVLFGGQSGSVTYGETWIFDGTHWRQTSPVHRPQPRRSAAMAYDPELKVVVLYGGLVPNGAEGTVPSDTWIWDGFDWTEAGADTHGPGPRAGPGMVTAGDRVILFAGHFWNTEYFGDAWTWEGKVWVRADAAPRPPGRGDPAIAWNPVESSLFVYGGLGARPDAGPGNLGVPLGDAWSMKGGAWVQVTGSGPPTTLNASAIWDSATGSVLVIFGNVCPNPVADSWAWNGNLWKRSTVPVPPRSSAAVAEDPSGRVLVFGGNDEVGC